MNALAARQSRARKQSPPVSPFALGFASRLTIVYTLISRVGMVALRSPVSRLQSSLKAAAIALRSIHRLLIDGPAVGGLTVVLLTTVHRMILTPPRPPTATHGPAEQPQQSPRVDHATHRRVPRTRNGGQEEVERVRTVGKRGETVKGSRVSPPQHSANAPHLPSDCIAT